LNLKIHHPPAYIHFSVADRITDGWQLQLANARRYHSNHFLNLAPLPQPFRFAMKMECLKAMLPQLPPKSVLVMLDAMDVLFNTTSTFCEPHSDTTNTFTSWKFMTVRNWAESSNGKRVKEHGE
jgi:hypothetical protein